MSESMINNLLFDSVKDDKYEKDTESVLRTQLRDKLKMAKELVQSIRIERAHKMGTKEDNP